MKKIADYQLEHAIEVRVSCTFAWNWRTDIRNWDDPPAEFRLEGPFADGTGGTTVFPGQEPLRWHIRDVRPEQSFTIEMPLGGAVLSFEWLFDVVSDKQMRITQRIVLAGDNAAAYEAQVRAGFEPSLASGMERIATAMEAAAAASPIQSC